MKIKSRLYSCGVEKAFCTGTIVSMSYAPAVKMHNSSIEAFTCAASDLKRRGYAQVGGREFAAPDNGPIRVLTKQVRFGASFRPGKEGTRGMPLLRPGGQVTRH